MSEKVERESSWRVYRRLLGYVKPYAWLFIGAVIANALYSAIDAGMVKLLEPIIDDVFVARDETLVKMMPLILPAAFLVRGLMSFISDYGMSWIARNVVMKMRMELFAHFQQLPADFYDNTSSGQLLSKLTFNIEQVAKASTDVIIDMIRHIFLTIFLLGVMFMTSWQLTLLFLVVGPIVAVLFRYASKRFRIISHRIQHSMANVTHIAEENIESYKAVRTFNAQEYEIGQFNKAALANRRQEMKMIVTKAVSSPLIQFVGGLALALTLYVATRNLGPNQLTAGAFATLMTAMVALQNPIKQLSAISNKFQQGVAGAESVFAVLDEATEEDTGTREIGRADGKIEFKNVFFTYKRSQRKVLHDISLKIKPGETVALVGPSGGGKTTLANLLPRFYDNYTGDILLDDINLRELTLHSLRNQISYVSQHVTLFNDTIANNIAYGQGDKIELERIQEAAKHANAHEFISALPDGYDTEVGENGILLSGGQRQRLAIARALCKNAPILILDEATSALDTQAERVIQSALDELMQNRTTIIIAHRLSTIEKADKIIVLEKGHVKEIGSHEELITLGGLYTTLHHSNKVA